MARYRIIITPDAEADLKELRDYIADVLLAPDTARAYIGRIRRSIASLAEMPERIALVNDEPWRSRGLRKIIVNNFYVYFRIAESANIVFILNVIYAKRDQLMALKQKNIDRLEE